MGIFWSLVSVQNYWRRLMAVAELMHRIKALIPQRPFTFAKRHVFRGANFVIEFVDASVIGFFVVNYM